MRLLKKILMSIGATKGCTQCKCLNQSAATTTYTKNMSRENILSSIRTAIKKGGRDSYEVVDFLRTNSETFSSLERKMIINQILKGRYATKQDALEWFSVANWLDYNNEFSLIIDTVFSKKGVI